MKRDECYTPRHLIEAARATLGDIDLDPASSLEANQLVLATVFYGKEDDGILAPWPRGARVWCNPPYSKPNLPAFVKRCIEHSGPVVLITSNDTSTQWAQSLLRTADAICFLKGRTQFYGPDVTGDSNRSGHIVWSLKLGRKLGKFFAAFSRHGKVIFP